MEQLLELEGHEVTLATSAEDGVNKFRAAPADIVITAPIMPTPEGSPNQHTSNHPLPPNILHPPSFIPHPFIRPSFGLSHSLTPVHSWDITCRSSASITNVLKLGIS
jgi:hypothetical protein